MRAALPPICRRTRPPCRPFCEAIEKAGYKAGRDVYLGLDVASSEFFRDGKYELESEHRSFSAGRVHAVPGGSGREISDHHDRGRHERG